MDLPPSAGGRPALGAQVVPAAVRRRLDAERRPDTPVAGYVYDPLVARRAARAVRAVLPGWAELFYAVKANSHEAVLTALAGEVDGFDVASAAEVRAVRHAAPDARLLATGPAKHAGLLGAFVNAGVELINVESLAELRRLERIAAEAGRCVPVLVRVNPRRAVIGGSLAMGGTPSAFGIGEDDIDEVLTEASSLRHVEVVGFHLHVASNVADAGAYAAYVGWCLDWAAATAQRTCVELQVVDVGGGLGVDFLEGHHLDLDRLGEGLAGLAPPAGCRVVFEPGRLLVADCGWYGAEVVDVKRVHGRWFVVVRGGIGHFLLPCSWDLLHPFAVIPSAHDPGGPAARDVAVTVVGELCTSEDTLARDWRVEQVRVGDLVVFPRAGAYGWEFAIPRFLGHPPASRWVITDDPGHQPFAHPSSTNRSLAVRQA